jgi:DNA-directed RNA polymerase specialized sigma24 family protein
MGADEPSTDAVDQLPALYASALRLRDAGLANEAIAKRIGVHPEAMDTVLRLAEVKLALLLAES